MTLRKVINGDQSRTYEQPKDKWVLTSLDVSCDPLCSPFVIFFGVVGFILSISFLWYQWYCHCNFGVPLLSFYFYFYFSPSPLSSQITKRREGREKKKTKKKKKKMTPYTHQNFNDNTTNIIKKIMRRWIKWHKITCSCDSLLLPLMTFLSVVGFISSRSFQ
jgi:hypothetical protein